MGIETSGANEISELNDIDRRIAEALGNVAGITGSEELSDTTSHESVPSDGKLLDELQGNVFGGDKKRFHFSHSQQPDRN